MTKHLKNIALAGVLMVLARVESNAQVGTLFNNQEVTDYISSMQHQDYTYLVWDRNHDGDGSFIDATRPMFFYWDNDDSRLGFLLDTRNMTKLKAGFYDLKLTEGLTLGNGFGLNSTAGASIFTGAGGQTFSIKAGGSSTITTFIDGSGVEKARINNIGYLGLGSTNPTSPLTIRGSDHLAVPDVSINSNNSLIYLGKGLSGPHGFLFGDQENKGVQLVYRTTPNQLIVEKLNDGDDAEDLFSIDYDTEYSYFKGNVGIGTATPSEKLSVNGKVRSKEVKVEANNWPDYVFTPSYNLKSLDQVETFINENGHLPNIPSAQEVEENNGIELGEMNVKLLEKIEELTLYTIDQQRKIDQLLERIEKLENQ